MPPEAVSINNSRIDPENSRGLDFHLPRALRRFEGPTFDDMRQAIQMASFRDRDPHKGEAQDMRRRLLDIVDDLEWQRSPEQKKLLELLQTQVEGAASVWTEGRHRVFTCPYAKSHMINTAREWITLLPPKVLNGFLKLCPETAQFVIVPDLSVRDFIQRRVISGKILSPRAWDAAAAGNWKFAITDSREDMPFDDTIYWKNPDAPGDKREARTDEEMAVEYARRFEAAGLTIMPQHGFIPTATTVAAVAIGQGEYKVFNSASFIAFKKHNDTGDFLPIGRYWEPPRSTPATIEELKTLIESSGDFESLDRFGVSLEDCNPLDSNKNLRCRPWYEGEIPEEPTDSGELRF